MNDAIPAVEQKARVEQEILTGGITAEPVARGLQLDRPLAVRVLVRRSP